MTGNSTELRKTQILDILSDGLFHSGERLGARLGISRTAISKHISQLRTLGLDVFSVTGKGYKWANPTALLNESTILSYFNELRDIQVHRFNVIDSTSTFMKKNVAKHHSGDVCVAEAQTHGRGRQGKTWISPFGSNLYFSMYWCFSAGMQALSGLSLVVGIALCEVLRRHYSVNAQLKWPNDVYVNDKKVAGILVEIEGQADDHCHCIIGIGLNICMPEQVSGIDQPWINLQSVTQEKIDKNRLVAQLMANLIQTIEQFEQSGLTDFTSLWEQYDWLKSQQVTLFLSGKGIEGVARGINSHGALMVEVQGKVQPFYGGEVSVRKR